VAAVDVVIFHAEAARDAGPLEVWVANARCLLADHHRAAFAAAGATGARIVAGPPDDTPFGARLRDFIERERPAGIVVLGSGSIPLATAADRRAFVSAASGAERVALTNNRFSADIVAVAEAAVLRDLPDLATDNALPRWLDEVAGYAVHERRSWRLGVDIDGPLDLVLLGVDGGGARSRVRARSRSIGPPPPGGIDLGRVQRAIARVRAVAADRGAELVVAGRSSAAALAWLERRQPARVRALIEERGLRTSARGQRPPSSILGALLDRDGPGSLGSLLAALGDAAILDSRVLLAHRLGAGEGAWPDAEDRFASDLLLHERIGDPWLRDLTKAAANAAIPIVLGGHTLVGPGLRLALGAGGSV
jgi:hypothetical protein